MKRKRAFMTVGAMLMAAFIGLAMINIGGASAENRTALGTIAEAGSAESGVSAATGETAFDSSPYPAIVKMIGALTVVIVAIYGGLFLLKRAGGGRNGSRGGGRLLEVLETAYVGPKKTVSLVRVAEKSVLIGVTEGQISVLSELDADETAALAVPAEETAPGGDSFTRLLTLATDKFKKMGLKRNQTALETQS